MVFWSSSTDIKSTFQMHKKTMRIMTGVNSRGLYRPIFKALKILMVNAQYTLSLMTFLAYNLEYFTFNNLINSIC